MAKKTRGSGPGGSDGSDGELPSLPEIPEGETTPPNVVPFKKPRGNGVTKGAEEETAWDREPERLKALNDRYCLVIDGGRTWVVEFAEKDFGGRKRVVPVYLRPSEFENFYRNRKVVRQARRGGGIVEVPEGTWWLDHPQRRTYQEIVFEPSRGEREYDGKLNLWRGFGVEEREGDWSLMERHIGEVIASGDGEHEKYLRNWLAWAVQNPGEPAEVVPVLRGKRGVGKGALANAVLALFGQHGFSTGSSLHLAGRFNFHLKDTCFVFGDEAFYPGDHRAVENLKYMITEKLIPIEGKGRDVIMTKNCLKIIMGSNEDWIVPAGENERRFFVVDVSDRVIQDKKYFRALLSQLEGGGHAAMLWELRRTKLGDWHPREVVRTSALYRQQLISMAPFDKWLLSILDEGIIPGHDPSSPDFAYSGHHYHIATPGEGFTSTAKREGVIAAIREQAPRLKGESDQDLARRLKDMGCSRATVKNQRGWRFPPLARLREEFAKRYPGTKFDPQEGWETDVPESS